MKKNCKPGKFGLRMAMGGTFAPPNRLTKDIPAVGMGAARPIAGTPQPDSLRPAVGNNMAVENHMIRPPQSGTATPLGGSVPAPGRLPGSGTDKMYRPAVTPTAGPVPAPAQMASTGSMAPSLGSVGTIAAVNPGTAQRASSGSMAPSFRPAELTTAAPSALEQRLSDRLAAGTLTVRGADMLKGLTESGRSDATQRYGIDTQASSSRYSADSQADASRYSADSQANASRYSSDKNFESSMYNTDAQTSNNIRDNDTRLTGFNIQSGDNRYNTDKNFESSMYNTDAQTSNNIRDNDTRLTGFNIQSGDNRYNTDKNFESSRYGDDKQFDASRYSSDKNFESSRYSSDKNFESSRYRDDNQFDISNMQNQTQLQQLQSQMLMNKYNTDASIYASELGGRSRTFGLRNGGEIHAVNGFTQQYIPRGSTMADQLQNYNMDLGLATYGLRSARQDYDIALGRDEFGLRKQGQADQFGLAKDRQNYDIAIGRDEFGLRKQGQADQFGLAQAASNRAQQLQDANLGFTREDRQQQMIDRQRQLRNDDANQAISREQAMRDAQWQLEDRQAGKQQAYEQQRLQMAALDAQRQREFEAAGLMKRNEGRLVQDRYDDGERRRMADYNMRDSQKFMRDQTELMNNRIDANRPTRPVAYDRRFTHYNGVPLYGLRNGGEIHANMGYEYAVPDNPERVPGWIQEFNKKGRGTYVGRDKAKANEYAVAKRNAETTDRMASGGAYPGAVSLEAQRNPYKRVTDLENMYDDAGYNPYTGIHDPSKKGWGAQWVATSKYRLRDGGGIDSGIGGVVPGTGKGDKIPAKYEPGEFVVSNDMLAAEPELRDHLRGLREQVLAEKGMTVQEADAKAVGRGRGLRAWSGYGGETEEEALARRIRDLEARETMAGLNGAINNRPSVMPRGVEQHGPTREMYEADEAGQEDGRRRDLRAYTDAQSAALDAGKSAPALPKSLRDTGNIYKTVDDQGRVTYSGGVVKAGAKFIGGDGEEFTPRGSVEYAKPGERVGMTPDGNGVVFTRASEDGRQRAADIAQNAISMANAKAQAAEDEKVRAKEQERMDMLGEVRGLEQAAMSGDNRAAVLLPGARNLLSDQQKTDALERSEAAKNAAHLEGIKLQTQGTQNAALAKKLAERENEMIIAEALKKTDGNSEATVDLLAKAGRGDLSKILSERVTADNDRRTKDYENMIKEFKGMVRTPDGAEIPGGAELAADELMKMVKARNVEAVKAGRTPVSSILDANDRAEMMKEATLRARAISGMRTKQTLRDGSVVPWAGRTGAPAGIIDSAVPKRIGWFDGATTLGDVERGDYEYDKYYLPQGVGQDVIDYLSETAKRKAKGAK